MATVKGDVHDIGKNIVGVVLQCNNYEVIDLGVMVPCDKILRTAREVNADIIGVSGLITPSLEEMVHVAKEMQREGFTIPLLIGGATTSRVHTAVKIAPHYKGPVIWVPDASRSVPVVSSLLSSDGRDAYVKSISRRLRKSSRAAREQKRPSARFACRGAQKRNENRLEKFKPTKPNLLGLGVFDDYPLDLIAQHIDWTPFFQTWDLAGNYPNILKTKSSAKRRAMCSTMDRQCWSGSWQRNGSRPARDWTLPCELARAMTLKFTLTNRAKKLSRHFISCASKRKSRAIAPTIVWRISSRRKIAA